MLISKQINFVNIREIIINIFLLLFWVLPILYVGLTQKSIPYFGKYLNAQYQLSCLFSKRPKSWYNIYYQVQFSNSKKWESINLKKYPLMDFFTNSSKFKSLYVTSLNEDKLGSSKGSLRRDEIVIYIKKKCERLYPKLPEIMAVRFVMIDFKIGSDKIINPKGAWKIKPLNSYKEDSWVLISEHFFE